MGANLLVTSLSYRSRTPTIFSSPPLAINRGSALSVMNVWLLFLLLVLGACRKPHGGSSEAGHLKAEWIGADRGRISAPATAEWCGERRLVEIRAIQGDTGFALALYPKDTLITGRYPVMDPLKAESLPPAAGIALRWFTQNAVKGFQGDTGTVFLDRSGSGELGGSVSGSAHSVSDTQRVRFKGTFEALTLRSSPECGPGKRLDRDAQPGDSVVH
jgi:hypothetical protein